MLAEFETMTDESRIWIFQSPKEFTEKELEVIDSSLNQFTSSWESHGHPLKASYKIFYNRIIIIAVDNSYYNASGCSIDKSVANIRELENKLSLSLLERDKIAYFKENEINFCSFSQLKKLVNEGELSKETKILDNTITHLKDLRVNWQKSAKESWISKYFNN